MIRVGFLEEDTPSLSPRAGKQERHVCVYVSTYNHVARYDCDSSLAQAGSVDGKAPAPHPAPWGEEAEQSQVTYFLLCSYQAAWSGWAWKPQCGQGTLLSVISVLGRFQLL